MTSKTWWDFFDEDPYERVGRYVPDAFGNQVIIHVPRISWAYLDWLIAIDKWYEAEFFKQNDQVRLPDDGSLDDWIEGAIRSVFLGRERDKLPRPEWCSAAHPAEYLDI